MRLFWLLWGMGAIIAPSLAPGANPEPRVVNVGVLVDGGPEAGRGSLRFETMYRALRGETLTLTQRDFDVRFPEEKFLTGGWDMDRIRSGADQLLADPEVDLVLAVGVFSTNELVRRAELSKPVIGPYAVDLEAQSIPSRINEKGVRVSGRKNLHYLTVSGSIDRDIAKFREFVEFKTLHILVDKLLLEAIPEIPEYTIHRGRELGMELVPVPVGGSADEALSALPEDAEAVYITPLLQLSGEEFQSLVRGLKERRLPSFSLLGRAEVELGLFAGLRGVTNDERMGRRVALAIRRILLGDAPEDLPVTIDTQLKLSINLATARDIGLFPSWRALTEAEVIGREWREVQRTLDLDSVVRMALESNLSLDVAELGVAAGAREIAIARAQLRPSIDASVRGLVVNEELAESSFGSQAERSTEGSLTVTQVLYSDGVSANLDIRKSTQKSVEAERDALRLDVVQQAANAFLDVLRTETAQRIETENLRLTESNLELASKRQQIGFSGPAEVFRWQSQLAGDRATVIRARNNVDAARAVLNQLLHLPQEDLFAADRPTLADPVLVTSHERLDAYVGDPFSFALFRDFLVREGLALSPELTGLDAAIESAQRAYKTTRRSFWSPDIFLRGELSRIFSKGGAGSDGATTGSLTIPPPDRDSWNVGVEASLPLFSGGARFAEVQQAGEELNRLRAERLQVAEELELRIRTSSFKSGSSYAAIDLAEEAAVASRKNLALVTDAYSQGLADILELLDAQNAAQTAEQAASNAIYDFLADLMDVQRAGNLFDFFLSREDREAWFDRLETHFAEAGYPKER